MHRRAVAVLLSGLVLAGPIARAVTKTATKTKSKSTAMAKAPKPSCAKDLAHCPPDGCGPIVKGVKSFDPNLNLKKNLAPSDPATQIPVTAETLDGMKGLADPAGFKKFDTREKLEAIGEGRKVAVVARLLIARDEPDGESCNCGLHKAEETDNHLVLVSQDTVDKFKVKGKTPAAVSAALKKREPESLTAEFTPRVRQAGHPNFLKKTMDPLIAKANQHALLVRITGMLMFDSQHFLENHLTRVNNWEIHPVLKMEFCMTGTNCTADSDTGWKSIDDLP